jgi:hypothetical protein
VCYRRLAEDPSISFAAIPKTPPFSEEDVELLNREAGPASPAQRAWLASVPAGVEHASGMAQSGIVAALDPIFAAYGMTGRRASASAISASAPALWRPPATAATSTPMRAPAPLRRHLSDPCTGGKARPE